MLEINKILKFLNYFSVITLAEDKIPNFAWKKYQSKKITPEKLKYQIEYKGGYWTDDKGVNHEIKPTQNFGIVTGFEDLEVIDVDLKVFSTAQEQRDFWNEFISFLKESILDFDDKFVIYKTKNAGFHILYKTKRVQGNLKIAKLKNHKEAVIETRGVGGYVFCYPDNKVSKKSYFDIQYISDIDRTILINFCKSFNHLEPEPEPIKKDKKIYLENEITAWDDFNSKTDIWSVINDEFTVVKNLTKKTVIKRIGATSPHSGYIFQDTGCMYLFSTGTIYPHEKLISSFSAFTYKYHNGNFSEASKDLYKQGFGTRLKSEIKKLEEKAFPDKETFKIEKNDLKFPIEVFPKSIQAYMIECRDKLDSELDYLGCSMLWLLSVCVGNSFKIEVKKGWYETSVVWLCLVGKAGIGKTPAINNIIYPLEQKNSKKIKEYYKKLEAFDSYNNLDKKEKENVIEVKKPIKNQFIANDITLEALVDLHQEADNSVGVFKDELAGWLKDMNKYREGSDLEFWLSCWSGKSIYVNRVTRKGSFVDKPFISVLGGIQPNILSHFYTDENKENGFMDRMLISFPETEVKDYNDNEISEDAIAYYKVFVENMYEDIQTNLVKRNENGDIEPHTAYFSADAKEEWKRIFNKISNYQRADDENEYMKSMYPKQKSYIPRFALLLHLLSYRTQEEQFIDEISRDSILKAEKLSNYFVAHAKKLKINSNEISDIKIASKKANSTIDKLKIIYENDKNFNRSQVAEILGVSRQQIIKLVKKLEN